MIPNPVNPSENQSQINPSEAIIQPPSVEATGLSSPQESLEISSSELGPNLETPASPETSAPTALTAPEAGTAIPEITNPTEVSTAAPSLSPNESTTIEKHLTEILENKDFKKESPHDAMEDILSASGPAV